MTVKEFAAALAMSLMDRGIEKEDAARHVITLTKTLTEDDLREITGYETPEEFRELSDSLSEIIKKKNKAKRAEHSSFEASEYFTGVAEATDMPADMAKTRVNDISGVTGETKTFAVTRPFDRTSQNIKTDGANARTQSFTARFPDTDADTSGEGIILGDDSTVVEKTVLTARGKTFFALISVFTSPLWLTVAAFLFSLFALSVVAVCVFTCIAFALVIAEVAAGGAGFFVGLIYGILKIVGGLPGTGLYEIGIGIIITGVTAALSVLTYSFATRTLPFILKEVFLFWGVVVRRIGVLIERFREECNRL